MKQPDVKAFFDEATFTVTYVVSHPDTGKAVIIDSVLDYDPASGRSTITSADRVLAYLEERGLKAERILETQLHADHLTAAPYLPEHTGAKIGVGANITCVQETFGRIFNVNASFQTKRQPVRSLAPRRQWLRGRIHRGWGPAHARSHAELHGLPHR